MSAFVVSDDDINILVTAYRDLMARAPWPATEAERNQMDWPAVKAAMEAEKLTATINWTEFGRRLWLENVASVAFRYGMPDRHPDEYGEYLLAVSAYEWKELKAKPEAIAKVARCYAYQSCEHDGWMSCNAKVIVDILEERYGEELPNYDAMPWGISGEADLAKARA
jgi:hypothetical protein